MGRKMEFPVPASVCSELCRTLCDLMDCSPHQAPQAPLSMGFSRQEYWNGLPFPPPGGSSQPRNQTHLSCLSCIGRQTLYHLSHLGSLVLWLEKGRGSKVPVTFHVSSSPNKFWELKGLPGGSGHVEGISFCSVFSVGDFWVTCFCFDSTVWHAGP